MEEKIITLKNYESVAEAMLDHDVLSKNKVMSTINSEEAVEVLPSLSEINAGVRIMVFEKDFDKAQLLLKEFHAQDGAIG